VSEYARVLLLWFPLLWERIGDNPLASSRSFAVEVKHNE
jgi:hypothetical protein